MNSYGTWKSPITSNLIVSESIKLGQVHIDHDTIYWSESRPSEKGRSVLMSWKNGTTEEILPPSFNARTTVHEYGGGAFTVSSGKVYFSNLKDQFLYEYPPSNPITNAHRFADYIKHPTHEILYAIQEKYLENGTIDNCLVTINLITKEVDEIQTGHDFYSSPTVTEHLGETLLAWLTWDHPNMPWDGSELWVHQQEDKPKVIAGGKNESVYGPKWGPDGNLYYVSDKSGYWNLYRWDGSQSTPLYPMEAEFGEAQWIFGSSRFDFIEIENKMQIGCIYTIKGIDHLAILDPDTKSLTVLDLPYQTYSNLHATSTHLILQAGSPKKPVALIALDPITLKIQVICTSQSVALDSGYISEAELIEFPTENNLTAFAFYYPPKNQDYEGLSSELPPLIVKSHGGPSSHAKSTLNLSYQFWTSRGYGILDVNYGGSTGHGRAYRERLNNNWGVVDIDDCVNAALFLVNKQRVDRNRLIIKGSSAGGYTTLAALTFRDIFKAGTSYYGISDLEALVNDTHKFEAKYLDRLIGLYPERKDLYFERAPIKHVDKLSCPLLFFQGADDKVVLPEQSEMMYQALLKKSVPVAYLLFENEAHGFRMSDTIKKCFKAELYFYSKIFHIKLSEEAPEISISNLD